MITITILIIVYIISCYIIYTYTQKMWYHPKGEYYYLNQDPRKEIIIVLFIPVLNTLISIMLIINGWKDEKYKESINFFKPKKPFKDESSNI